MGKKKQNKQTRFSIKNRKLAESQIKINIDEHGGTVTVRLSDPSYFSLHTASAEKPGRIIWFCYRKLF